MSRGERARALAASAVVTRWCQNHIRSATDALEDGDGKPFRLLKTAKYSPEFLQWVGQQRFIQPETRNRVLFQSLEEDEQKRIHERWKQMTQGSDAERVKEENRWLQPNPNPKRYDHLDFQIRLGDDEEEEAETKKLLSDIFGTKDPNETRDRLLDLAGSGGISGMVTRARARVYYQDQYETHIRVEGGGRHGLSFTRTLIFQDTGDEEHPWVGSVIQNDNFSVDRSSAPPGVGTRMLASQVGAASDGGFSHIETDAAGGPGHPTMNGYYTWPRLGFNAEMTKEDLEDLEVHDPEAAWQVEELAEMDEHRAFPRGPAELYHIMAIPAARKWWEKQGHRLMVSFPVSEDFDGGKSYQLLRAYTEAKAMAEGQTIPEYLSKIGAKKQKMAPELTDQDNQILDRVWDGVRKTILRSKTTRNP